ncbi:MAG TPA: NAD-dependent succinate-semialdehyde dehydrogenase [Ktedonobacterales bacterium]
MSIQSTNPTTGETIAIFEPFTQQQQDDALTQARGAFTRWRETSFAERATFMQLAAAVLRARKDELARMMAREMGKPIAEGEAEVEKCAWNCEYYAEHAAAFLAEEPQPTEAARSYVRFDPLGPVLAVMPWNFPFWQVFRFAAPSVMAGNTVVLKHASNVPGCALAIETIFSQAGFPEGIFRTLLVSGDAVERLIADPRIAAVTFTGSAPAGARVAAASGASIKHAVLELGGSDAFIVLEDADLEAAAAMAVRSRFQNTGQSCIAAKRFIVVESVADAFTRAFAERARQLTVGDPFQRATQIGPMARADLRAALAEQVRRSVAMGARVVLGGEPLPGPGFFFAPTILADVTPAMPVFREETFGPVAAVIHARDAEHAIQLANDSDYGLGGNLWTRDLARAKHIARRLESGNVFINGMTASDPRLPFGGVKRSGFGRELGVFGIREFVNIQTLWIGPATGAPHPTAHPAE